MLESTQKAEELKRVFEELEQSKKKLVELLKVDPDYQVKDYELTDSNNSKVKLSSLFGDKKHLIAIHNMGSSCPYCTMWADGFNGIFRYLVDGTYTEKPSAFILVSPESPEQQKEFAKAQGWKFPLYSSKGSDFTSDLGFEQEGSLLPGASIFSLENGTLKLKAQTYFGPGDLFCSVWSFVDLL